MNIIFTLLIVTLVSAVYSQNLNSKINFAVEFIKLLNKPDPVNLMLCWRNEELKHITKELWQNSCQVRILNSLAALKYSTDMFLLDSSCAKTKTILDQAESRKMFKQPLTWVIFDVNNNLAINYYNYSILPDSQIYLLRSENENTFDVVSPYKVDKSGSFLVEHNIAKWTHAEGVIYYNPLNIGANRNDLHRIYFNVSLVLANKDSVNHLEDYRYKNIDSMSKGTYIQTKVLMDFFNANINITLHKSWGYPNKTTGLFDGMVGELQWGNNELAASPIVISKERMQAVDYVGTNHPTYGRFIFRAPPLSLVRNVLTLPFQASVWLAILLIILFTLCLLYIVSHFEWKDPSFREKYKLDQTVLRPEVTTVMLMEMATVCQQGSESEPKSVSGRILTLFMLLFLMFMYTSYSANVVALLQSTSDSLKTLQDLLNSNIKLGAEDVVYNRYFLKVNRLRGEIERRIYDEKLVPPGQKENFLPALEGLRKVRDEYFAFMIEISGGYKIVGDIFDEDKKCNLREMVFFIMFPPHICIRKKSSYKELVQVGMRRIRDYGIEKRMNHKIISKKPTCSGRVNTFSSVGITDCYFPFLIFLYGSILSFFLLVLEEIHFKGWPYFKRKFGNDSQLRLFLN